MIENNIAPPNRFKMALMILAGVVLILFIVWCFIMALVAHWSMALLGITIVFACLYFIKKEKKNMADFLQTAISKAKKDHHIDFSVTKFIGSGPVMLYNTESQKILIVDGNTKNAFLKDFSFIRTWQLNWQDLSDHKGGLSHKNVKIDFETTDLNLPAFSLSAPSLQQGKTWVAQLNILFN